MCVLWSGMGKEVYCSSSRELCAQLAVDARRSRTTLSWQEVCAGDGSSVLYVRESQYASGRPVRAQQRSVRVRAGRVYGCGVLADRKLSTRMQGECMGGEYVHVKTESYCRHRYKLESVGKEGR